MAVNKNPPIILDPSMDDGHRLTFINQNFHSLADSLDPFTLSDGSNDRLLIGKDSVGNYVVKVSQAGFDAFDATDAQLVFNSSQDIFKIVGTGSTTFDITGTTQNISIAHGLSFTPIVFATVDASFSGVSQGLTPAPSLVLATNSSVGGNYIISAFCQIRGSDATNIKFFVGVLTGIRYNGTINYYILQETAN